MINKFLEYLHLEKNYSKHTIKNYRIDLESLQAYLLDFKKISLIQESLSKDIRDYIAFLSEKKYSETTISRKVSAIKSFFKFLKKIETIEQPFLVNLKAPKIPKKINTIISEQELKKLLDNDNLFSNNFKSQRNKTIIDLFYSTGIRKSELIGLKISDLDFYKESIKVIGKRNKQRIIPVAENLITQIKCYLLLRNEITTEITNVFISEKGKELNHKTAYNIVKNNLTLVTVKQKKNPHILRHSFATHLLNNGADISTIKELLGHTSLSATQHYTSVSISNLKKVFNQAHPRGLKIINKYNDN